MHNLIRFCMIRKWFAFFGIPVAYLLHAAAGEPGYNDAKWAFLDTPTVLKAAGEITVAKYPDSDDAIVEKKMIRLYRADGTGESQDEAFVKVLTEKGKRGNRSLSLYYMLPYATAEVVQVEVLKPSGNAVPVDPSTIEVKQVTYKSKDGTPVTMFIVHKKGLKLDGSNPTILNGYGGFDISMTRVLAI